MIDTWYWMEHASDRRRNENGWFLYLCAGPAIQGHMVVKVGISQTPFERALSINNGCPFPILLSTFVGIGSLKSARRCEKSMLSVFGAFRTRGEWLCLPRSVESRRMLRGAAAAVVVAETGYQHRWRLLRRDMMRQGQSAVIHANLTRTKGPLYLAS